MSVLLKSLSVGLEAAAERHARRAARRRRQTRLAGVLAIALLGLTGAAAATGTLFWQPELGNESQGHATASPADVPSAQRDVLAVLRRPQTDADRGAAARYAVSWVGKDFHGVRTNSVRVLSNGAVLFSAERGPAGEDSLCLFLADKEAGGITCTDTDRLRRDGFAIITMPAPDTKYQTKNGTLVLREGQPVPVPGSAPPSPQPVRVTGVVPDGVAAVRFGQTAVTVRDNAYDAHLAPGQAPRQTLLDAYGAPWNGA
ncbi:MAG TPA: hypothetical protein VF549_13150 [Solirubrobacteraceae bacterium]|jgi:hypothetical protein